MTAPITELRMLSWTGYGHIISQYKEELEERYGLKISVREVLNADFIYGRFSDTTEDFDIVVVDWEYRHRYANLVRPIKDTWLKVDTYLAPFQDVRKYYVQKQLSFVPLRFGTNAVIYRLHSGHQWPPPIAPRTGRSLRQFLAEQGKQAQPLKIGVWNWWLPNLMLLAKAAGHQSPHALTEHQLAQLRQGEVVKDFIHWVRGQRPRPYVFEDLEDIITHELTPHDALDRADWILGPSEMVLAPIVMTQRRRGEKATITWEIPKEGGLIWLETAAVSRKIHPDKVDAARRFLQFMQEPEVQVSLMCGCRDPHNDSRPLGYWAYCVHRVLDSVSPEIRAVFHNEAFAKSADDFGAWLQDRLNDGDLSWRTFPTVTSRDKWYRVWLDILHECKEKKDP